MEQQSAGTIEQKTNQGQETRRYSAWRIGFIFLITAGILFLGYTIPVQPGDETINSFQGAGCNCTTDYRGFPLIWIMVGTENTASSGLIPSAHAQVDASLLEPMCLPGCQGIVGINLLTLVVNFVLIFFGLFIVDRFAVRKGSHKLYWWYLPIFLVFIVLSVIIPGDLLVEMHSLTWIT